MTEKTVKVQSPTGVGMIDGIEISVEESNERWSEVTLADGTIIKIKTTVISAVRVLDQYDQSGNPLYAVNQVPTMVLQHVPANLKKKIQ